MGKPRGRLITHDELRMIVSGIEVGMKQKEIAKQINRSAALVGRAARAFRCEGPLPKHWQSWPDDIRLAFASNRDLVTRKRAYAYAQRPPTHIIDAHELSGAAKTKTLAEARPDLGGFTPEAEAAWRKVAAPAPVAPPAGSTHNSALRYYLIQGRPELDGYETLSELNSVLRGLVGGELLWIIKGVELETRQAAIDPDCGP